MDQSENELPHFIKARLKGALPAHVHTERSPISLVKRQPQPTQIHPEQTLASLHVETSAIKKSSTGSFELF
jgi:hypothetical protein